MSQQKSITQFVLLLIIILFSTVQCFPTSKLNMVNKVDFKEEKRYPNGSVIGNYNYVDKDGNPVQVMYYADDTSYGVELKSMKLLGLNNNFHTSVHPEKQAKTDNNLLQASDSSVDSLPDFYNNIPFPGTTNKNRLLQVQELNKEINKESNTKTSSKTSPDYEIYLQNELQAPKKCGKDKVRIYIDKGKRKIREVLNDVATFKYCDQF